MGQIIDISSVLLDLGLSSTVTDEERAIANIALTRAEGAVKRYLKYDPVQRDRVEFYPQTDYDFQGRAAVWETNDTQAFLRRQSEVATNELYVQHIPIRSVGSLFIDLDGRGGSKVGGFEAESLKTEGTDFWPNYDGQDSEGNGICRDGIIRSFGQWPTTAGSVKIVYTAGYSPEELHGQDSIVDASPIMDAVLTEAVRRAQKVLMQRKRAGAGWTPGPITSETLGDYSYSVDGSALNRMFGGLWDLLPESITKLSDFENYGWTIAS